MSHLAKLSSAPIAEAVIDFRLSNPESLPISDLRILSGSIGDGYPKVEEKNRVLTELRVGEEGQFSHSSSGSPYGFWCASEDNKLVAQIRRDGLTFSMFRPYTDWNDFSGRAHGIWDTYRSVNPAIDLQRIALRYINHIDIPIGAFGEDVLAKYLELPPIIPDGLPQEYVRFSNIITIWNPDIQAYGHVRQELIESDTMNELRVALDIDVFHNIDTDSTEPYIWDKFETLRQFKNSIFDKYTTDFAKREFQ